TAIACLEHLTTANLPQTAVAGGLRLIEWPARLPQPARGPLVDMIPGWQLWLDGGHNPAAGEALAGVASGWSDPPLGLVVAMLTTKDSSGFLAPLARHARSLHAVTIPDEENPLPAAAIAATARALGIP